MSQNLVDLANGNAGSTAAISLSPKDARSVARLSKKHSMAVDVRRVGGTDMIRANVLMDLVNAEYGENTVKAPSAPLSVEEQFEESQDSLEAHISDAEDFDAEESEDSEFKLGSHRDGRENYQIPGARRPKLEEYTDIDEDEEEEERPRRKAAGSSKTETVGEEESDVAAEDVETPPNDSNSPDEPGDFSKPDSGRTMRKTPPRKKAPPKPSRRR